MINFPASCTEAAQKISYKFRLYRKLVDLFNVKAALIKARLLEEGWEEGGAEYKAELEVWLPPLKKAIIKEQIRGVALRDMSLLRIEAKSDTKWLPLPETAIDNGAIVYPPGLNLANESSKIAFLCRLIDKLEADGEKNPISRKEIFNELVEVQKLAEEGTHWDNIDGEPNDVNSYIQGLEL